MFVRPHGRRSGQVSNSPAIQQTKQDSEDFR